jgi:pimeloyl-ACP methyl ester carboxylesterase
MKSVLLAALAAAFAMLAASAFGQTRVATAGYVPLGGIDQWVTIRGDDDSKPILLLVHGGPADAQSYFASAYAPYENDFLLVQWDQRGAGRTFAKYGDKTPDMTLDRAVADGIELAQLLRGRFPGRALVVLGHSWGSVVATGMVQKRPDLFAAYVGTGQVASWAAGVNHQFDFLKGRARATNDAAMLASLEAIGRPDPTNVTQYFTFSRPLRQHMNPSDTAWLANLKTLAAANGETDETIKTAGDGMTFSGQAFIQTMVREDLATAALNFALPYCVIQGRHDLNTPTDPAKAYFDKVQAPRKYYAVIEDAGHFALSTHQARFISELKKCLQT